MESNFVAPADFLVIGAAGLVGSHVRAALGGRSFLATYHRTPVPGGVPLDVTDGTAVRDFLRGVRPHVIVLAAAEAYVERCEREPEATRRVNVDAARIVADGARGLGALLVIFSSEYVFDGRAGPYGEEAATNPLNEYGRQKIDLEEIARTVERHLVCRTSGVFGWETSGKNFVCRLVRQLRTGERFVVSSDQVITATYAPDLARAVVALVDRGHIGTFNVVGPRVLTRVEFASVAAEVFGLSPALLAPWPTSELGLVAPRPLNAGLRDDKLRVTLGHGLTDPADALRAMRAAEAAS